MNVTITPTELVLLAVAILQFLTAALSLGHRWGLERLDRRTQENSKTLATVAQQTNSTNEALQAANLAAHKDLADLTHQIVDQQEAT